MKKALTVISAGLLLATPFVVHAAGPKSGYVGANYADLEQYNINFFDSGERFSAGDLVVRIGGHLNQYFSSELRVGTTASPHKGASSINATPAVEAEFSREYMVSAMLKAGYPLGPVTPYVTAGYTFGKEKLSSPAHKDSDTFKDISFGAGIDLYLGESFGINAEFTQYYDIGPQRLQGPSAGVFWRY